MKEQSGGSGLGTWQYAVTLLQRLAASFGESDVTLSGENKAEVINVYEIGSKYDENSVRARTHNYTPKNHELTFTDLLCSNSLHLFQ